MNYEIKHRFTGAALFSLECDSLKLCVQAALESKANLRDANLSGADLRDADLRGADLSGAKEAAQLGQPNGWNAWTYLDKEGKQRVRVGCQDKTIADGRLHWSDKEDRREVMAALDYAEAIGNLRGWQQ